MFCRVLAHLVKPGSLEVVTGTAAAVISGDGSGLPGGSAFEDRPSNGRSASIRGSNGEPIWPDG